MSFHAGDSGISVPFLFTNAAGDPLDLSDATLVQIEIQPPRMPWVELEDLDLTDIATGGAAYDIVAGDVDFFPWAGRYDARGYFESPTLGNLHTDVVSFPVLP